VKLLNLNTTFHNEFPVNQNDEKINRKDIKKQKQKQFGVVPLFLIEEPI